MTLDELKLILRRLSIPCDNLKPWGKEKDQVQIPCPLAPWFHSSKTDSHPSLSIKFENKTGWTVFKCWACKEQGKLWELVQSLGALRKDDSLLELANQLHDSDRPTLTALFESMSQGIEKWTLDKHVAGPMVLSEDVFKHFHPAWEHSVSRVYLSGRDVSPELCTEFGLLYDTRQERVVFPVRDRSGNLVGGVGRAITGREPRYFNYLNFPSGATLGGHDRLDNERPFLIVVEGFFDLLRCYRWAHDVESDIVCTWKSEVAEAQADLILQLDKSIQIWYDGDEAGREGWNKASRSLGPVALGLRRATLPEDKDPGELVEAEFLSVFRSTMGALR